MRATAIVQALAVVLLLSHAPRAQEPSTPAPLPLDLLIRGARVLDGAGNPWVQQDVGVRGDRIAFVGHAGPAGVSARDTLDARGLVLTPGFIDAHSHFEADEGYGRDARPFLYQGITTAVIGLDGGGTDDVDAQFARFRQAGIGLNVLTFVGHGAARSAAMGQAARAPTTVELDAMRDYVRRAMRAGAFGLSSGLFYSPGTFARTDELIELAKVAAEFGGIYDTHDRDLGAVYGGVGMEASMREAIEIGERGGTPVIFSHLSPQGRANAGRAPAAAALIEAARARGVNVMAAQHPYTATQSNLRSYLIPDWAAAGGHAEMLARFRDPALVARLDRETMAMAEMRGGADKVLFVDARPELNGRTVAQVADSLHLSVPAAVRRVLERGNAAVMNLDLYDMGNVRYLAQKEWMMTCTDGRSPPPGAEIVHPRPYGAFTRKLRLLVLEDSVISLPFAVRGMTSLAATFFGLRDRGLVREGYFADVALLDLTTVNDRATIEKPHVFAEGTVHVLVNGRFAIRDRRATGALAGRPIRRGE